MAISMRRIVSKEDEAKKKKRNQIILGVCLGVVMLVSTLSFAFQNQSVINPNTGTVVNETDYNGFKFVNQNDLWFLGNFSFTYLPQEVGNSSSVVNPFTSYQGKPLYVYSEDQGAEAELSTNLGGIAERIQEACPAGTVCQANIPTKTCSDNFIIIKGSNSSNITQQDNCVFITGPQGDLVRSVDEFLFKTFGIKK